MEAYLDNSATTVVADSVREIMIKTMTEDFGNPSSLHMKGVEAEKYLRTARDEIAGILKVQPKEIIFTSGGTESNNLAIIGTATANARAGKHIITTAIEHASVLNTMHHMEELGFSVTYLPVDKHGKITAKQVFDALTEDTILVSVMHVNNEVGAVEPVEEIGEMLHKERPEILFHVDGIQSFGKYQIRPKKYHIDLFSVSGHKIHGPKGSGFLYVSDRVKIKPILFGGGQQRGLRSGTDNVPGIAGIGEAAALMYRNFDENTAHMYELKDKLIDGLGKISGTVVHSERGRDSAPHIVNVSFIGVRSEVMLHTLEAKGIYVSSGSACSSNHPHISETLSGMGLSRDEIDSAIRFSLCEKTTGEEIDYALEIIGENIETLRKFTRRK